MYILKLVVDFNFISSDLYVDGYGEKKGGGKKMVMK